MNYQSVSIMQKENQHLTSAVNDQTNHRHNYHLPTNHHKQFSSIKEDTRTSDKLSWITFHGTNDGERKIRSSSEEK